MRIGFDLDRIFINYPPFVPDSLIDWLYKNHQSAKLSYRIPTSTIEIMVRQLSHHAFFRPPMSDNIAFLQKLHREGKHSLFLISGRYSFLHTQTHALLKRYGLSDQFEKVYLNVDNEQSHLFKERIIGQEKINFFVDDDSELVDYLRTHCLRTSVFRCAPPQKLEEIRQFLA